MSATMTKMEYGGGGNDLSNYELLYTSTTAGETKTIDFTKYKELIIIGQDNSYNYNYQIIVPVSDLGTTEKAYMAGFYLTSAHNGGARIKVSKTSINFETIYYAGAVHFSNMRLYAR